MSPQILLVGALFSMLYFGAHPFVVGAKKIAHNTKHMIVLPVDHHVIKPVIHVFKKR